jgi:hypothetical protein
VGGPRKIRFSAFIVHGYRIKVSKLSSIPVTLGRPCTGEDTKALWISLQRFRRLGAVLPRTERPVEITRCKEFFSVTESLFIICRRCEKRKVKARGGETHPRQSPASLPGNKIAGLSRGQSLESRLRQVPPPRITFSGC